ncbi:GNAT family N-acetyltransferase [Aureispira anguillae]|uniref:GNAT family N-acetyltransferase n=1 Tax=Aureispira anguillae TaxID=2864201 RepID=A0A916DTZ3_9BACT|nr:GNAT family N-acetyltransferase [Aureispira anguillae]BDS12160.1 GNAT family N-acetyltransferase [Aureispira anguillae]
MHQTERLMMLPFAPEHFNHLLDLFCNNKKVMTSALKGRVLSLKEFLRLLSEQFILSPKDDNGFLCLFNRQNHQFVGVTGLLACHYLEQKDWEFGFILHQDYWGKGLATEIGNFWIDYAKNNKQLSRILATTRPDNHLSKKVLKKLRMQEQKTIFIKDRGQRLVFVKDL